MRTILLSSLLLLTGLGCAGDDAPTEPLGVELPSDPNAVVLRWSAPVGNGVRPGGTSRLVITAGGDVYQSTADGPQGWRASAAPPEPSGGGYVQRRIEPAGLQLVLERASALGLLAPPPEYADIGVTDSASTEIVLTTADGVFTHVAYALARPGDESDEDRRDLARFVEELSDLERLTGGGLGAAAPYEPSTYSVWVEPVEGNGGWGTPWPASTDLGTVDECVGVPTAELSDLGGTATSVEVVQDGAGYLLRLVPVLPVDEPCQP